MRIESDFANARRASLRRQRGSFLLESLMAILIVSFGILGLVGLQSRAIQNIDDAQFRSEAVFLTNALIGQMWTSDPTKLADFKTCSPCAGTPYEEFKNIVQLRLPGASGKDPTVDITPRAPGPPLVPLSSVDVTITVFWQPPGNKAIDFHQFQTTATIGFN